MPGIALLREHLADIPKRLEFQRIARRVHEEHRRLLAHLAPAECGNASTNEVDGDSVPVRHFGAILPMSDWEALADKLRAAGTRFVIEPHVRFQGQVGEQATMFFLDPSGNALEFKAFGDISQVFAK